MDKQLIANTLKTVKENSPKRNFKQSIDLIITLKDLDLKKTEHQINTFVTLQHDTGKKASVCALVGPELEKNAKEVCDQVILSDQFDKFKDKKEIKKLANIHEFFISQANIMPKVATVFGRYLGPKGKMPNPKIGGVLPPNANIKQIYDKLSKTIILATKNEPTIKCIIGKEDSNEDQVIDNALTIYNNLLQKLPNEKQNVKKVMLKLTMGPVFVVGEDLEKETKSKKEDKEKKETKSETKPKNESKPKEESKTKENKEQKTQDKEKTSESIKKIQ